MKKLFKYNSKIWLLLIELICILIFIVSAYKLYNIQDEYDIAVDEYESLANSAVTMNEITINNNNSENKDGVNNTNNKDKLYTEEKYVSYSIDLEELKKINNDTVGWIILPDTAINYPILQTDNNDKYLNTTFEGKQNSAGALYLDMNSNINKDDNNLIIYGHNLKNGKMFRALNDLIKVDYFNKHKVFHIDLGDGFKEYEIVSCYETVKTDIESWQITFDNKEHYKDWLNDRVKRCTHPCMKVDDDKRTIILSTCRGRSGGNGRFVVYLQERDVNSY